MYAIIKTGGKQYKVSQNDILNIDRLDKQINETVEFTEVIAINSENKLQTGEAIVNSVVLAEVIAQGRDKKVIIYKKRRRKDSKLKKGFRRSFTKVRITKITL